MSAPLPSGNSKDGVLRTRNRAHAAGWFVAIAIASVPRTATAQAPRPDPSPAMTVALSYSGAFMSDVDGGLQRGTVGLGVGGADFTVQLDRLVGWDGARVYVSVLGIHGDDPSARVGDVQGVSNLAAPSVIRVEEAWFQQNLFANRASWLVGRFDLNAEFYRLESAFLFVNSSFGIGPEFSESGVSGPSIYPNTSVGTRLAFKPSRHLTIRVAMLDGVPVDRPSGGIHLFAPGDGALFVAEAAWLSHLDVGGESRERRFLIGRGRARTYGGKLALGVWGYSARFPDLSDTLPGGTPIQHSGSRGAYLLVDQPLWSSESPAPRALRGFLQLGVGDGRVNQTAGYIGAGLTLSGAFAGRADDQVGLGLAAAINGSHFKRAYASEDPARAETAIELTYLAQIFPWLSVQSDAQYVLNPGGVHSTPNALVLGANLAVSF